MGDGAEGSGPPPPASADGASAARHWASCAQAWEVPLQPVATVLQRLATASTPRQHGPGGLRGRRNWCGQLWKPSLLPNISFNLKDCYEPQCVHRTRAEGGGGFLRATCSVNAQRRDEARCQLTLPATIQSPRGNNTSHPESTGKQHQGTLYQNFPSFLRSTPPPNLVAPKRKPQIIPHPVAYGNRSDRNSCPGPLGVKKASLPF